MKYAFLLSMYIMAHVASGQVKIVDQINKATPKAQAIYPLRFLASDELMGRGTTRPEIHVAARYISEEFRSVGLKEISGTTDYFQKFDVKVRRASHEGNLTINGTVFQLGKDIVQTSGSNVASQAAIVYLKYGTPSDWDKTDVKGKIVIVDLVPDTTASVRQAVRGLSERQKMAHDHGAVALIARFRDGDAIWAHAEQLYQGERLDDGKPEASTPVFLLNENKRDISELLQQTMKGSINATGNQRLVLPAENVMGYVEGTSSELKDEFVVLTAHYDHLGLANKAVMEEGKLDSIYNGARDNAIGVAAMINAARYFAKHPPKRSVLFIAYTAEEMGMGGSRFFAENPTIPLRQLVYNLNIDGGGYNDTTMVTIVGLRRTSADDDMKNACISYGLKVMADPVPQLNLFDRSDNVSLAAKGIPAPTFSLGFSSFDETIAKRYHQVSDEVGDLNMNYILRFMRAYILAAKNIADNPAKPKWKAGDKYEEAWKNLFQPVKQ